MGVLRKKKPLLGALEGNFGQPDSKDEEKMCPEKGRCKCTEKEVILRESSWAPRNLSRSSLSLASLPILPQKTRRKQKQPPPAFKSDQVPDIHSSWRSEMAQIAHPEMIYTDPFAETGPGGPLGSG